MPECSPRKPGIDVFHRERSRFIDAFAQCETAVLDLLGPNGGKGRNAPFAQPLIEAQKFKASPRYAKSRKIKVDEVLGRLIAMAALRADIVHSQLKLVEMDGTSLACFVNVRGHDEPCLSARLISLEDLRSITRQVESLAGELRAP